MLQACQRLGEFEIVRLLGKGGMGEVYEAQQDSPRRRVALKVLAPWLAENEDALKRFWREAEVPAQLNHPGIVRIISTGKTGSIAYYTMHLVQGLSLADMIRHTHDLGAPTISQPAHAEKTAAADAGARPAEGSPCSSALGQAPALCRAYEEDRYRTVARVGVMVARALAHAHGKGCVHRDLKPGNIMVDEHDQAYVMDFGLTRALEPDGVHSHAGSISGTPWYMSPEQARGEPVDYRSDIYSLGVTLYELASRGHGPYSSSRDRRDTVLTQVRSGQYLPLRSLAPDVPPALESVIHKAMSYRPQSRYQDAGQLAQDLERFLEQASPSRTGQTAPPRRRWAWPVLLGGAVAVLALVALAVVLWRGGSGSDRDDRLAGDLDDRRPGEKENTSAADYPDQFKNRLWQVPQGLFTVDHKPVWHRRLAGTGQFKRVPGQLGLAAPPADDHPTLIALDDDPQRRWFAFSVELMAPQTAPGANRGGVFFGWRNNTKRFFFVELDEHPAGPYPHGVVKVGTLRILEGGGAEAPAPDLRWLPVEKGLVPLTKSKVWHSLTVQAVDDRISVTVDGTSSSFTLDWLAENNPDAVVSLHARGALGIWAWNAPFVFFRNASVTAMPSGEKDK